MKPCDGEADSLHLGVGVGVCVCLVAALLAVCVLACVQLGGALVGWLAGRVSALVEFMGTKRLVRVGRNRWSPPWGLA